VLWEGSRLEFFHAKQKILKGRAPRPLVPATFGVETMAIQTETIKITSKNGTFDGYLAIPESTPAPGVIVIQ
jgi:hypothetical protein